MSFKAQSGWFTFGNVDKKLKIELLSPSMVISVSTHAQDSYQRLNKKSPKNTHK